MKALLRDLDELGQMTFLKRQAGYVDPGYRYLPTVTYWTEDFDGETEWVMYYRWSPVIPERLWGPHPHPSEGGAEADTVTKDGVPVELNTVPDDIYDDLMRRANEQGDRP